MQGYASIGQSEGGGGGARPLSGYRFPSGIIVLAVRWYRRYRPSHADMAELLADRGVAVDPSAVCTWAREFAALDDSAGLAFRRTVATRWRAEIVCTQMTKAPLLAAGARRDNVADLHLAVRDDDAVDEQLDELALLLERGI
ncbi:MAG: hypothetical protein AVDCRST_MAG18-3997, partial [uncultured Thermomicrobiales bacterium]